MLEYWTPAQLLVHLAALTYVIGFLIRDQLILRGLVLVGTGFYIAYYYVVPEIPLWDAIAWSVVLGLANAFTMMRILGDRRPMDFVGEERALFCAIPGITPSDFRKLMALADVSDVAAGHRMTERGAAPEYLTFVFDGVMAVEREDDTLSWCAPAFVGEISYLLVGAATATTILKTNSRIARWNAEDLRALVARNDGIRAPLEAAFNRDLAQKLDALSKSKTSTILPLRAAI